MKPRRPRRPARATQGLTDLLKPYWRWIAGLVALTFMGNGLNLIVPKLIAEAIDGHLAGSLELPTMIAGFLAATLGIFVFTLLQTWVQTYASERVARDLRSRLAAGISGQDSAYIQRVGAAKLLTNLTSDIDSIKLFVAQGIASIVSSSFLIVGASVLMVLIDWQLAAGVLLVVPVIAGTFGFVISRVRKLFRRSREAVDWLNRVINESIVGAALIRLLNSQHAEYRKFLAANAEARDIGLAIIDLFASLIPIITFAANLAMLVILVAGGHFVIAGQMSLGEFTAFNTYLGMLIFPIIMIGFMSNVMAQASASYERIAEVLEAPAPARTGTLGARLEGKVEISHLTVAFGQRTALEDVSFVAEAGSRTAIIGPTAAGKTQLLYAMVGLVSPRSGTVLFDGRPLDAYDRETLHRQIGLVFQDSAIFNLSLRENIAFSETVDGARLGRAIETAELAPFVASLPDGLDTVVSERGTSLSGGQKQRITLARALALDPKILLLDDFTARVDPRTEGRILEKVRVNYPGITLISVTQKVAPVIGYDQIVLMMEGQVLARGTHAELMASSPEYVQIYDSQQSTEDYELRA